MLHVSCLTSAQGVSIHRRAKPAAQFPLYERGKDLGRNQVKPDPSLGGRSRHIDDPCAWGMSSRPELTISELLVCDFFVPDLLVIKLLI